MKFMIVCLALAGVASAATFNQYQQQRVIPSGSEASAPVLRSESNIEPDGSYQYAYETGNGISGQESGIGGVRAQGSNAWTAPDGTPIQLTYIADENGYQPVGAHLPTPPPTPAHVLRALEWIAAHPSSESTYRVQPQVYRAQPVVQQQVYRVQPVQQFRQATIQRPFAQNPAFAAYRRQ